MDKTIVYSDALDVEKCKGINVYCKDKIKASFGIGTHFTGDFGPQSPPLNMVIKLNSVFYNGFEVFVSKLSDSLGKEQGHPDAIKEAKYVFFNQSLGS